MDMILFWRGRFGMCFKLGLLVKQIFTAWQEKQAVLCEARTNPNPKVLAAEINFDNEAKKELNELRSERSRLERENQDLQEVNAQKEAMMHMIVHDMKNPLISIMGALTLAQGPRYEMDKELKELLTNANIQSIKLRTMIDDILTMSKMRSRELKLETVDIDLISLMQQSVLLMNTTMGTKKVTLRFEPTESEIMVSVDFQMIERVINNIINNAIKYAPVDSEVNIKVSRENENVCVHVRNWGEAIPAEYHQKIFEMFGRAKPHDKRVAGTGLGLAFCKLALEAHGGSIAVESPIPPENHGAHFYFTLPILSQRSE